MVVDYLLIALASIWTVLMLLHVYQNITKWNKYYIQYQTSSKIFHALTHFSLLTSIWVSVFQIGLIWMLFFFCCGLLFFVAWRIVEGRIMKNMEEDIKRQYNKLTKLHKQWEEHFKNEHRRL